MKIHSLQISQDQTGGLFHSFYYRQYSPLAMTVIGSLYSIQMANQEY
jgi:hypothetical protein